MIDFFRTLFRPTAPSGATAKERLRLVLLSDHLSLAPDVVEDLKRDLLAVISRYVEIDSEHADVSFEHREREVAMLASIPIRGVRERRAVLPDGAPGPADPPEPSPSTAVASPEASFPERASAEPQAELGFDSPPSPEAAPATAKVATAAAAGARPRRRRRKKPGAAVSGQRPVVPQAIGQPAAQA